MEYGAAPTTNYGEGHHLSRVGDKRAEEARPLEEITTAADDLTRMNEGLDKYLSRFNGPRPAELADSRGPSAVQSPPCYRSEIERLRRTVAETGALVDLISRTG